MMSETETPIVLSVVIPCYNEEEVLPETVRQLGGLLDSMVSENLIHPGSHLCLVDDGSKDKTTQVRSLFSSSFYLNYFII